MSLTTRPAPRGATRDVPKDNTSITDSSPPPAYTPTSSLSLPQITAVGLQRAQAQAVYRNSISVTTGAAQVQRPLSATILSGHADEVDLEDDCQLLGDDEDRSPISLRINTSINVTQSNNVICISDTPPADHANAIAKAVVKAMRENSSGHCGIPMIDEDGRPRPIKIEVDASMLVEGSGNIIGNAPVINEFFRQRAQRRKREDSDEAEELAPPARRRRSV